MTRWNEHDLYHRPQDTGEYLAFVRAERRRAALLRKLFAVTLATLAVVIVFFAFLHDSFGEGVGAYVTLEAARRPSEAFSLEAARGKPEAAAASEAAPERPLETAPSGW